MVVLLSIWFVVSYLLGIVFVEPLNQFQLGGFPLGFWFCSARVDLCLHHSDVCVRLCDGSESTDVMVWTILRLQGVQRIPRRRLSEHSGVDLSACRHHLCRLHRDCYLEPRRNDRAGFYVAGRGIPPLANGMATAADWMSAASFISMAGLISFMGYTGTIYLMGWTGGYVLLALLLAPYLRKYGRYTIPEFVGDRYYSQTARVIAVFCAIFVSFTYVAGQMRGVGVVFSRFLEVDVTIGVIIGVGIVFFYAVVGGMRGITYTQVAHFVC